MFRLIILIIIQSVLIMSSEVFLKFAVERMGNFSWSWTFFRGALTTWQLYAAGIAAIAGAVEWMIVLKHYPLSQAFPLTAINFIVSMIAGYYIFHETIPPLHWLGAAFIMVGAFLISK